LFNWRKSDAGHGSFRLSTQIISFCIFIDRRILRHRNVLRDRDGVNHILDGFFPALRSYLLQR